MDCPHYTGAEPVSDFMVKVSCGIAAGYVQKSICESSWGFCTHYKKLEEEKQMLQCPYFHGIDTYFGENQEQQSIAMVILYHIISLLELNYVIIFAKAIMQNVKNIRNLRRTIKCQQKLQHQTPR